MSIADMARSLAETPELPLPPGSDPEQALLVEEAKIGELSAGPSRIRLSPTD